jgi:hypothetical protein
VTSAGGPGDEQVHAELLGQEPGDELPAHALAGGVQPRPNVPIPPLPGETVTIPPPTPLFAGRPTRPRGIAEKAEFKKRPLHQLYASASRTDSPPRPPARRPRTPLAAHRGQHRAAHRVPHSPDRRRLSAEALAAEMDELRASRGSAIRSRAALLLWESSAPTGARPPFRHLREGGVETGSDPRLPAARWARNACSRVASNASVSPSCDTAQPKPSHAS